MDANRLSVVVQDHVDEVTGAIWTMDTVASVTWDDGALDEAPRHIVKRTFTRSRGNGTETRLELTPLNAIVLGEVQYVPPKVRIPKPTPVDTTTSDNLADIFGPSPYALGTPNRDTQPTRMPSTYELAWFPWQVTEQKTPKKT
jgi:hypothetical protein